MRGWKYKLIKSLARKFHISEDAINNLLIAKNSGKPTEAVFPEELLYLGSRTITQGLLNLILMQGKTDWVFPHWVNRQFNPKSPFFIPRSMSPVSLNITNRNWTACGYPDRKYEIIVDPRGLITPKINGWSIDIWLYHNERPIFPSTLNSINQKMDELLPMIITSFGDEGIAVCSKVCGFFDGKIDFAFVEVSVENLKEDKANYQLGLSIRPYNPEGISPITQISFQFPGFFVINDQLGPVFSSYPDKVYCSNLEEKDVSQFFGKEIPFKYSSECKAGMCTGLATFSGTLAKNEKKTIKFISPLYDITPNLDTVYFLKSNFDGEITGSFKTTWKNILKEGMNFEISDHKIMEAFQAHKAWLLLFCDGDEITPGPATYHHFWFRDAAYMLSALHKLGYFSKAEKIINCFPFKQLADGYFLSQQGEWDSNGQAIWTIFQFYLFTSDIGFLKRMYPSIRRGVLWIEQKRLKNSDGYLHKGLLPAGFSAEHLGTSDYYYWDNFWALAGVDCAIKASQILNQSADAEKFKKIRDSYFEDIEKSLQAAENRLGKKLIPASPYRDFDCGAIGSICIAYPLQLILDQRTENTITELFQRFCIDDAFYQEFFHSGLNPYLTLQLAECFLLFNNPMALKLFNRILDLSTPTYTYPEAIHPLLNSGVMGDGHHGWASAEIIHFIRNLILVEKGETLEFFPVIFEDWFKPQNFLKLISAPSEFGRITLELATKANSCLANLSFDFHRTPKKIKFFIPSFIHSALINNQSAILQKAIYSKFIEIPSSEKSVEIILNY